MRSKGNRELGSKGYPQYLSRVGVDAGRNVERDPATARLIHALNQLAFETGDGSFQAGTEQRVDHHVRSIERRLKTRQVMSFQAVNRAAGAQERAIVELRIAAQPARFSRAEHLHR
jgi:hypothetical protein